MKQVMVCLSPRESRFQRMVGRIRSHEVGFTQFRDELVYGTPILYDEGAELRGKNSHLDGRSIAD